MNKHNFVINKTFIGLRLDIFLSKELNISRSQIKKMVDEEKVLINEKKRRLVIS